MATQTRSKKNKKKINPNGIVHIKATFNNTNITVTDENGNIVSAKLYDMHPYLDEKEMEAILKIKEN